MSVTDAVAKGDHRAALEAIAAKLANDIDDAPSTVVAQIAGRLQAVLAELNAMPRSGKVSTLDDLAQRRASRIAETKTAASSGGQVRERRS